MNFFFLARCVLHTQRQLVAKTLIAELGHSLLVASSNGLLLVLIWQLTTNNDLQDMWQFLVIGFILFVIQLTIAPKVVAKVSILSYQLAGHLRERLAQHANIIGFGFFGTQHPDRFADKLSDAIDTFEFVLSHSMNNLLAALIIPPALLLVLIWLNWQLAMLMGLWMILVSLLHYLIGRKLGNIDRSTWRAQARHRASFLEMLDALPLLQTSGAKHFWQTRLANRATSMHRQQLWQEILAQPFSQTTLLLLDIGFVITLWAGTSHVSGNMDAFTALAFALVGYRALEPLKVLLGDWQSIRQSDWQLASAKKLLAHQPLPIRQPVASPRSYGISFENVTFGYDLQQDGKPIINQCNVHFSQHACTALVGESGSGKTTMMQLAMRFWDVHQGCIRIGNDDIRHIPQQQLHTLFSPIFQSPFLLNDTLLANIALGNPQAGKARLMEVLHESGCIEIAKQLPNGVDTLIGSRGMYLSGGQQQLVAIARSMLKDAPIVLFDEATAALDPENAHRVYQAVTRLAEGKTLVVIAHNLHTIVGAQQIVVLAEGRVAEQGTHQQLLEHGGQYATSWHKQQSAQGWKITLAS